MNTNQYGQVSHIITDSKEYAVVFKLGNNYSVESPCRLHVFFVTNTERKASNYLKKLLKYNQPA